MKRSLRSYLFITVIIFLFMLELPTTKYPLPTAYADNDNDGPGNNSDGSSLSDGGGGITGSVTDEQGNTTTFDNLGNITGESGPGGGSFSEGSTNQGPGGTGGEGGVPGGTDAGNNYSAAETAALSAQTDLTALTSLPQEAFAGNPGLYNDIANAQAAYDKAMSDLSASMEAQFPGGTFTPYDPNALDDRGPPSGPAPAGATAAAESERDARAAPAPNAAPPAQEPPTGSGLPPGVPEGYVEIAPGVYGPPDGIPGGVAP